MIKKIYLSRAQTRAMAIEHPIGDPTGGAAYGEKNDPISAAIAIGSMGATYAAAGTFAAMTVLQGITFAGAALSLVGNVTGNKSLMKLGMVVGIAGGIGSLAEGAGLFGPEGSGNLGETLGIGGAETTTNALSNTPVNSNVQVNAIPDAGPANVTTSGPLADVGTSTQNELASRQAQLLNNPATENVQLLSKTQLAAPTANTFGQTPGPAGPNAVAPAGPGVMDSIKAGNYGQALSTAGGNAMDLLKNNPTGAYVAAQAVGAVANVLSGKTGAELEALKANTGYANAKALEVQEAIAKEQRRRANVANGYGNVNTSMKVNTNTTMAANPTGLITGARG